MNEIESDQYSFHITSSTVSFLSRRTSESIRIPTQDLPEVMTLFEQVMMVDRRRAFRVPLGEERLKVTIDKGNQSQTFFACDISMIGIGIWNQSAMEFEVDDKVKASFELDGQSVRLDGIVRAVTERVIGIEFPTCHVSSKIEPPKELRKIVAKLEMEFIRERRNRAW